MSTDGQAPDDFRVSGQDPAARESVESLVGTTVAGKYRVDALIGMGGMGAVFRATNVGIGKRVALKFLTEQAARDREAASRFQREALAASMVESSHIVQIFDSGTSESGLPFLVMELLSGEDLRARLEREGRLPADEVATIAAQVLRALVRAHAAGIVHRDLKPDNVYLCQQDDGALFVKLVDFGISKLGKHAALDTLTTRGTVLGTAFYMSPEQAQAFSDVDGRTDLFSLGTILYECVTGKTPHTAPTYEAVLVAICTRDPVPVRTLAPDLSAGFAAVIQRALARDRTQRFASAQAMLDALNEALPELSGGSGVAWRPHANSQRAAGSGRAALTATPLTATREVGRRRVSRVVGVAALALCAGFGVAALALARRGAPTAKPALVEAATVSKPVAAPAPSPDPTVLPVTSAAPASAATARTRAKPARPVSSTKVPRTRGVAHGLELVTEEP